MARSAHFCRVQPLRFTARSLTKICQKIFSIAYYFLCLVYFDKSASNITSLYCAQISQTKQENATYGCHDVKNKIT